MAQISGIVIDTGALSNNATTIIVAIIGALTAISVPRIGRRNRFNPITQQIEVYKSLPEESTSRKALLKHIDDRIAEMTVSDSRKTRDPAGIASGLTFITMAIATGIYAQVRNTNDALWILILLFVFFGVVVSAEAWQKKYRTEMPEPPPPAEELWWKRK